MVWKHAHTHNCAPFGMTEERWKSAALSSTTYHGYIQEQTKDGKRIETKTGKPTVEHMQFDGKGVEFVFANCRHCTEKDFTSSFKSGADPGIKVDDPDTPCLGRCGCVRCTKCYLVSESTNRGWNSWVACPACGFKKSQHKNEIFWIVNNKFYERMENTK